MASLPGWTVEALTTGISITAFSDMQNTTCMLTYSIGMIITLAKTIAVEENYFSIPMRKEIANDLPVSY